MKTLTRLVTIGWLALVWPPVSPSQPMDMLDLGRLLVDRAIHRFRWDLYWHSIRPPEGYRVGVTVQVTVLRGKELVGLFIPQLDCCQLYRKDKEGYFQLEEDLAGTAKRQGEPVRVELIRQAIEERDGRPRRVYSAFHLIRAVPGPKVEPPRSAPATAKTDQVKIEEAVFRHSLPAVDAATYLAVLERGEDSQVIIPMIRESARDYSPVERCGGGRALIPRFVKADPYVYSLIEARGGCRSVIVILGMNADSGGWRIVSWSADTKDLAALVPRIVATKAISVDLGSSR